MSVSNEWHALGVVNDEPVLKKLDTKGGVMAKTVLVIAPEMNGEEPVYLPIEAYNKKAHVLCALAHRGSTIFVKGKLKSNLRLTSQQGKTLVGISFKVNDFAVLIREPVKVTEMDFAQVVQLYEPEAFMATDEEEEENEESEV